MTFCSAAYSGVEIVTMQNESEGNINMKTSEPYNGRLANLTMDD